MIKHDFGRIFIPQNYSIEYSKSPQAIIFDDYIRFYFSYCVADDKKLKSKVGYVDFNDNFQNILQVSTNVIEDGELGCFDEHGIFPFSPFKDGNVIKALISGWTRRVTVSVDTGIGLAISRDYGNTFERYGDGPILTSSLYEPFLVIDGFIVKRNDETYQMFYIYGTEWNYFDGSCEPERTYKIGTAFSNDLLTWKKYGKQLLSDKYPYESQALPSVIFWKGKWRMFYCYRHSVGFRENSESSYKIGYAESEDLLNWDRLDDMLSIPMHDWNINMQCYPNVFEYNERLFLAYNGNHFGRDGFGLLELELD